MAKGAFAEFTGQNICLVTFIMNQLLCMLFISHEHESAHLTLYLV